MKLPRREFLHLAAGAAALPVLSGVARAEAYPTRPVRIIVNLAPGGGLDFNSRLIGEFVSRSLGQQVIVENKPGAGGMIGIEAAAKSAPDGYTILTTTDVITSGPRMRQAVIYLRVSTIEQTTANQERELREIASRMGCEIVKVYRDHGISGAKGRDKRPAFDKLCRDARLRR